MFITASQTDPQNAAASKADDLSGLRIDKSSFESGGRPRRGRRRSRVIWLVLLVAAAAAGVWGWGVFAPATEVRLATLDTVYPDQVYTVLTASGYVVAQRKAAVASEITGLLTELNVEEGDAVKANQIIARLENDLYLADLDRARAQVNAARYALREARAELTEARLAYNRNRELVDKEVISRSEFDAVEARFKRADAAVDAREAELTAAEAVQQRAASDLDNTFLRAPFNAVVLTKNADVGDIVTPIGAASEARASVVTIADMTSLQVEADVSETAIGKVRPNQPAVIRLDAAPDDPYPGRVHKIVPTADRSKASVQVKVSFEQLDDRVLPEMSAKVAFLDRELAGEENKPLLAAPKNTVTQRDGQGVVFVFQDGTASMKPVTLGRELGGLVEIRGGAQRGDRLVLDPPAELADGGKIEPAAQ